MSRRRRTEPSLPEWAALGLLCEEPAHGWAIAHELSTSGSIGRVYSCTRPLAYRALAQLREAGLAEVKETAPSDDRPGPDDPPSHQTRPCRVPALARQRRPARSRPAVGAHAEAALPRPRRPRPRSVARAAGERTRRDRAFARGAVRLVVRVRADVGPLAALVVPRRALVRRGAARQQDDRAGRVQAHRVRRVSPSRDRRHAAAGDGRRDRLVPRSS